MVEWRPVPGYEKYYLVSNTGQVKSLRKGILLKQRKNDHGYWVVDLSDDVGKRRWRVHRLVALAFIPNPNNYPEINHLDCNPANPNADNLEWCTHKQNMEYKVKCGRSRKVKFDVDVVEMNKTKTVREIARELGVSCGAVALEIERSGNTINRITKYGIQKDELKKDILSGKSNKELSKKYCCSANYIGVKRYQLKKGRF